MKLRRTEKQVQRDVRRVLELHGYQVDDMSQPRRSMMPLGLPDLRARHAARQLRFWVEVKAPDGRLTSGQEAWHAMEEQSGGTVYVVRSGYEMHEILVELHATVAENRTIAPEIRDNGSRSGKGTGRGRSARGGALVKP